MNRFERESLPSKRRSTRVKADFVVDGNRRAIFIEVGFYADGRVAEVFLDTSKEGTFMKDTMNALAMMVSISLQYGTPVEEIIDGLSEFSINSLGWTIASLLSQLELERISTLCGPPFDNDYLIAIKKELELPTRKELCKHIGYERGNGHGGPADLASPYKPIPVLPILREVIR